jgi:hypothetical protein
MRSYSLGRNWRPPSGTAVHRADGLEPGRPGALHRVQDRPRRFPRASRAIQRGERFFRADFARRRCQGQHMRLQLARRRPLRSYRKCSPKVRRALTAFGPFPPATCPAFLDSVRRRILWPTASSAIASGSSFLVCMVISHTPQADILRGTTYFEGANSRPAPMMKAHGHRVRRSFRPGP